MEAGGERFEEEAKGQRFTSARQLLGEEDGLASQADSASGTSQLPVAQQHPVVEAEKPARATPDTESELKQ